MHRYLRSRLRDVWRSGGRRPWPDVALAVALGAVTTWMTILAARTTGDAMMFRVDLPGSGDVPAAPRIHGVGPPDADGVVLGRDIVLNLMLTLPLAGRRRWPLACLAIQFAGILPFDIHLTSAALLAMLIGAYSLVVYGRSVPLSLAVLVAAATAVGAIKTNTWPELPHWAGAFTLLLSVGLVGAAIRAARARAHASHQRAEALEREQQAATRLAVAQERARIARELHDVVSHHVSVMTIQAGAAGKVMDSDPELARGALTAIESSGRETMAELRHLLGVLAPGPTDDLLAPQPGLAQLDVLVDKVRQAGQPVSVREAPAEVPRGLELTAYRVVQEALTNALRYAPGAATEIVITTERSDLVVDVTNDAPPGERAAAGTGSGTGLLGLAERLRLYGGTLETGRRVGGGFRVHARVPLDARVDAALEAADAPAEAAEAPAEAAAR